MKNYAEKIPHWLAAGLRIGLMFLCAALSTWAALHADNLDEFHVLLFLFSGIPIALLTQAYGFLTGIECFTLVFITVVFMKPYQAYFASYYLASVLYINLIRKRLVRGIGKWEFAVHILLSSIFTGTFFYIIYYAIGGRSVLKLNFGYLLICIGLMVPVIAVVGILCQSLFIICAPRCKCQHCSQFVKINHTGNWRTG